MRVSANSSRALLARSRVMRRSVLQVRFVRNVRFAKSSRCAAARRVRDERLATLGMTGGWARNDVQMGMRGPLTPARLITGGSAQARTAPPTPSTDSRWPCFSSRRSRFRSSDRRSLPRRVVNQGAGETGRWSPDAFAMKRGRRQMKRAGTSPAPTQRGRVLRLTACRTPRCCSSPRPSGRLRPW